MNAKRKMIIAISAFAMAILATVVAVVAILAAQNVTIKSSLNVQYLADANVIGSVKTSYVTYGESPKVVGTQSYSGGTTDPGVKDFIVGDIVLEKGDNNYVEFTFEFENTSTVADYTATLSLVNASDTGAGTLTNMNVYVDGTKISSPNLSELIKVTVNKNGGSESKTLKVQLADSTKDAAFKGTLKWVLISTR